MEWFPINLAVADTNKHRNTNTKLVQVATKKSTKEEYQMNWKLDIDTQTTDIVSSFEMFWRHHWSNKNALSKATNRKSVCWRYVNKL